MDALTAALRCGSPAACGLADRLGLPARFPFRYQVLIRRPAGGLPSVADLSPATTAATLRRWVLPSAAERAERLGRVDAAGLLPEAGPAVRYAALRLEQLSQLATGVPLEAARRVVAGVVRRTRLRVVARLPWRERLLLARYLVTGAGIEVALRLTSPRSVVALLSRTARPWAGRSASARSGRQPTVTWRRRRWLAARAASVLRPGRSCLPEALLLWRDALALSEPAWLVIGVRAAPAFLAHAWVEGPDGTVFGTGTPPPDLSRLAVWDPDGRLSPGRCARQRSGPNSVPR